MKRWRFAAVALVILVGAGILLDHLATASSQTGGLTANGTIEATEVTISSEVNAQILDIPVVEGQSVRQGDVLVRLDNAMTLTQYRQADPLTQQVLAIQLEKYTLRAPRDGVILRRSAEPGEVAVVGAPLLVLADLSKPELTVYVPQRDLATIQLGERVEVTADAFGNRRFAGQVVQINNAAEFTPRTVQTVDGRLNLVFAVKIAVQANGTLLKPGMTVVAHFGAS
ncbi:MAG TPA: HlyD family efflux transporter periplasmic adaptor subunit [Chloroflexota bacterium]|nr:HlyD family efflux transporter periplasmic adaptor subunit [Chloroflexota bacterium]